jgi:hypothetical protein
MHLFSQQEVLAATYAFYSPTSTGYSIDHPKKKEPNCCHSFHKTKVLASARKAYTGEAGWKVKLPLLNLPLQKGANVELVLFVMEMI